MVMDADGKDTVHLFHLGNAYHDGRVRPSKISLAQRLLVGSTRDCRRTSLRLSASLMRICWNGIWMETYTTADQEEGDKYHSVGLVL